MTGRAQEHGNIKSYLLGFILSLLLTLAAFLIVSKHLLAGWNLALTLAALALSQMTVQFILFLHLGQEDRPRWNLITFLFMALVLVVIVFGSLWIMYSLDYRMMPST